MSISEKEACEIFYKTLNTDCQKTVAHLQKMFPTEFKDVNINDATRLHFYAAIYCATLAVVDYFDQEQSTRLRDLLIGSMTRSFDYYRCMKQIHNAHLEWDEPLYKPDPDHPYETIARYLYLKWGIPKQEIKIGEDVIQRPNLIIVYAIEGTLIASELTWKMIKDRYIVK